MGDNLATETENAWKKMVDGMLDSMFMSRQASINSELMTAEEADAFIMETSKKYMEKYANMDDDDIHRKMEVEILSMILSK